MTPPPEDSRFRALLDAYGSVLRKAIARTCPTNLGLDFDDIEQDARLRLWRALDRETELRDPASFLYRVAVTATLDALRRQRTRREVQAPDGAVASELGADVQLKAPSASNDPELETARGQLLELVLARLHRLPEDRRRAVALYLQGFTHREIGELLDWTEHRSRNLVHRGLKQLRSSLRREGIDYEDR